MGRFKMWFEDKVEAMKQTRGRVREWARNNPKEATILGVCAISTIGGIAKAKINYNLRTAQMQPKTLWDPSLGVHQELNRPLDSKTKADLNNLVGLGYSRHEAMKILKLI